jgi:GH43 family beta-xylosidase
MFSTMYKYAMRTLLAVVIAALTSVSFLFTPAQLTAAAGGTFQNPLNLDHGSDPWMLYYNGYYYLAATTWSATASPGLTMKKAASINALITASPVTVWSDPTPSRCCNYWAPEFHLLNGPDSVRWYMYYVGGPSACCDYQRIWVLESSGTDPMGPYSFKGQVTDYTGGWMIDPTVASIDGNLYLIFSAFTGSLQSLYIAPMSDPTTVSGDRVLISVPTLNWEMSAHPVNEGPEILQHNGTTFLIYSASFCGTPDYKLGMLTLTGNNPLIAKSWTKDPNPVFQRNDANGIYGPGHNGFFKSPDGTEDWIVYHANTSVSGGCDTNRTTRIQKFTWNADGTPNFGVPLALSAVLTLPSGDPDAGGPMATPAPTSDSATTVDSSVTGTGQNLYKNINRG